MTYWWNYNKAWIKGRLTIDEDCDNTERAADGGLDSGIGGVTVKLLNKYGHVVATTTTDSHGNYQFDVKSGYYKVSFGSVSGYDFARKDVGDYRTDSDANSYGLTDLFYVGSGKTVSDLDASLKPKTGDICGTVFCDIDCDGVQDSASSGQTITWEAEHMHKWGFNSFWGSNASGHKGVKTSYKGSGDLWQSFNGSSGTYSTSIFLQDENDGRSTVMVKVNGHVVKTILLNRDNDGGGSDSGGFSKVDIGQLNLNAGDTVGIWAKADGAEYVRIDKLEFTQAGSGSNEPGKAGVTVQLLNSAGTIVATTTTDANGDYKFDGVAAGSGYRVKVVAPQGQEFTAQNVGNNDSIDSDVDGNGLSGSITVPAGGTVDVDAGLKDKAPDPGSLSGRYFEDTNDNDQDDGNGLEPGIGGVLASLLDSNGNPATDINGNTVASVFTGANGSYSFGNLAEGNYTVVFTDPNGVLAGKDLVNSNVGPDASDSDALGDTNQSVIPNIGVVAGQNSSNNDAGAETPAPQAGSLSGRYFEDTNDNDQDDGNGSEPGIGGVLASLLDSNGNPATDINGNTVASVFTGANGSYSFSNLAEGNYTVVFTDPNGVLAGKDLVNSNVGPDASDSDAIGDTGTSAIGNITVVAGQNTPDNDAGAEEPAPIPGSLSGRYFEDTNNNDQDDGNGSEPGIGGVVVSLLDSNGNPATDINGNPVASVFTAVNGSYSFNNLAEGNYTVVFTDPIGVLAGKDLVNSNVGPDASDSDAIGDTTTSSIGNITVVAGQNTPDNDAGVEEPAPQAGSLSGRYFEDTNDNDQDDGNGLEPGIGGVLASLLDSNGNPATDNDGNLIPSVFTAGNGSYSFGNLAPGSYEVVFTDPNGVLAGKDLVNSNVGPDASDSDAIGDTTTSSIGNITVVAGQNTPDNDAGVEEPAPNSPPDARDDDAGKVCEDDIVPINVLANDTDSDGGTTVITSVDGQAISEGQTVVLSNGVAVMLVGGQLQVDGANSTVVQDLIPGEEELVQFEYGISDGQGGSDTANVSVTFCGEYEDLADLEASLPSGQIMYTVTDENRPAGTSEDAYSLTFMGTGDVRLDGVNFADAYCLDIALLDVPAGQLSVALKGSLHVLDDNSFGTTMGIAGDQVDNVVNYILNTDYAAQGYTDAEVQGAIWGLFNNLPFVAGDAGEAADAQAILDDAKTNGVNFEVMPGDQVGLVVTPEDGDFQPFVVGIEYTDCLC